MRHSVHSQDTILRNLVLAAALAAIALPGTANAQVSDALRKKVLERKQQNEQRRIEQKPTTPVQPRTRTPQRTPRATTSTAQDDRVCQTRERILEQNKNRQSAFQGELVGIDAEIRQLEERLAELRRERQRVQGSITAMNRRVDRDEAALKSSCGARSSTCGRYETMASQLDSDSTRLENESNSIRGEIRDSQNRLVSLRRAVEPLRTEYQRLRCDDLVAGETQQRTIDRCSSIFSDWNRRQAELNRYQQRIPSLQHRYQTIVSQLDSIDNRAKNAEAYLNRNCRTSRSIRTVQTVHRRRSNVRRVGDELRALSRTITDLKNLRITVDVR